MAERTPVTRRRDLTALFRQESPRIHGLLLVRCGNRGLAEELTAQTFEAAATQFARGQGDDVTPAWLSTVALRRLVDHWRTTGRLSRLHNRIGPMERTTAFGPEISEPGIWTALNSLSATQRAAMTLRYLDDRSVAEVAETLELSYRATESVLARGRRSLRVALAEEGIEL